MKRPTKVAALNSGQDVISLAAPTDPPKAKPPTLSIVSILKGCRVSTFETGKPAMATVVSVCTFWKVETKLMDAVAMILVSRIV